MKKSMLLKEFSSLSVNDLLHLLVEIETAMGTSAF